MIERQEFLVKINPEQWKIGPLSVIRRNGKYIPIVGKEAKLAAYQEALREELLGLSPRKYPAGTLISLRFAFSRYIVGNAKEADATNLQKGTEDALQGILFDNDREVVSVVSCIYEQRDDSDGWVYIACEPTTRSEAIASFDPGLDILRLVAESDRNTGSSDSGGNVWPPVR